MKRPLRLCMMLAAAPLPGFAQGAASARLSGQLLITGSSTMIEFALSPAAREVILSKPGKLSALEFQLIQGHAQASYEVLKGVEFSWPVAGVGLQHRETSALCQSSPVTGTRSMRRATKASTPSIIV